SSRRPSWPSTRWRRSSRGSARVWESTRSHCATPWRRSAWPTCRSRLGADLGRLPAALMPSDDLEAHARAFVDAARAIGKSRAVKEVAAAVVGLDRPVALVGIELRHEAGHQSGALMNDLGQR